MLSNLTIPEWPNSGEEEQAGIRSVNAKLRGEILIDISGITTGADDSLPYSTRRAYHLYTIRLDRKDQVVKELSEKGLPISAGYTIPQYKQPYLMERNFDTSVIKNTVDYKDLYLEEAEKACSEVVFLSQTVLLTDKDTVVKVGKMIKVAAAKQKI